MNWTTPPTWLYGQPQIGDDVVAGVTEALRGTGVVREITSWDTERRKSRAGRKPKVTHEAVLVGLLLAALHRRAVNLIDIAEVLFRQISPAMQITLRVPIPTTSDANYLCVRSAFATLAGILEPNDYTLNRVKPRRPKLRTRSRAELDLCEGRLHRVCNAFIDASIGLASPELLEAWDGSVVIDDTPARQFIRVRRSEVRGDGDERGPFDVDGGAGWYIRNPDDREGTRRRKHGVFFPAYDAALVTMANGNPDEPNAHPNLVLAMWIHFPSKKPGWFGTRALEHVAKRYSKRGYLVVDRAYNNSVPDDFQEWVIRWGWKPLYEFKDDQLGVQSSFAGAIQLEGTWACPGTPTNTVDATKDLRAGRITEDEWLRLIEERTFFHLRVKDAANRRYACPALGPNPSVGCPLRHGDEAPAHGKRLVINVPEHPDRICTNKSSVTFDRRAGLKQAMALPYGSPLYRQLFPRHRSTVEGFNGTAKDASIASIGNPTTRRRRGIASQGLLIGALLFATNVTKFRNWYQDHSPEGLSDTILVRRRRTHFPTAESRRPNKNANNSIGEELDGQRG